MNQTDILQFQSLAQASRVVLFTDHREDDGWISINFSLSPLIRQFLPYFAYVVFYLLVVYVVTEIVINSLLLLGSLATLGILFVTYSGLKYRLIESTVAKWFEPKPLPKSYLAVPKKA